MFQEASQIKQMELQREGKKLRTLDSKYPNGKKNAI